LKKGFEYLMELMSAYQYNEMHVKHSSNGMCFKLTVLDLLSAIIYDIYCKCYIMVFMFAFDYYIC